MSTSKKYLFIPLSGLGYLFPAIRLAHILEKRGNRVCFATAVEYNLMLQTCGIETFGIRNNNGVFLNTFNWYNEANAQNEVPVLENIINSYKPDFIVTNPLVLCGFFLAEKYNIPTIVIGFTEYLFPGVNNTDLHKEWRLKSMTDFYNKYREVLNYPPIEYSAETSPLIGNKYLLKSIPQFNEFSIFPPQVELVGGLYWEPPYYNIGLQNFINQSKSANIPVVYIQIGRLFEDSGIWQMLVQCLEKLPYSFVVDTGRSDYIPYDVAIPANFYLNTFIPLGVIANDIAFVICSGQSTSIVSAIIHGKQILSIPHSTDSKELTQTLVTKGLVLGIHDKKDINFENIKNIFEQLKNNLLLPKTQAFQRKFQAYDNDETIYQKVTSGFY